MTRRGRILLVSLFATCALVAYGVYWWHQVVLDEQALEDAPYTGALLDEIDRFLQPESIDRSGAEKRLLEMPDWDRDRIISALSQRGERDPRMVAVAAARKLRDRPIPRAVLARLALEDPDAKVKEAARKALNGEP